MRALAIARRVGLAGEGSELQTLIACGDAVAHDLRLAGSEVGVFVDHAMIIPPRRAMSKAVAQLFLRLPDALGLHGVC